MITVISYMKQVDGLMCVSDQAVTNPKLSLEKGGSFGCVWEGNRGHHLCPWREERSLSPRNFTPTSLPRLK